jgi:hypothetical protein
MKPGSITLAIVVAVLYAALAFSIGLFGQTLVSPKQIRGLGSVVLMQCAGSPAPGSDCTGMLYVDLVGADGREWKIIGTPPPPGMTIDPTYWSVVQ